MKTLRTSLIIVASTAIATAAPETLRVTGSNTFGEKLGPLLVSSFERTNPGIDVVLKRPGSGPGLAALIAGQTDVAPTSRPPNYSELQAAKKAGAKLVSRNIGSYGVAIVVNDKNRVKSLKPGQIRSIFNGKINNWSKVRGDDKPVTIYILDKNTGARGGFQEMAMRGDDYAASAVALPDYASIVTAVAKDSNAIGYADMGPLPAGVRSLLVSGQPANGAAIYEQVYPYASKLFLCTLDGRETPAAKKFVRYALSKDGQRIIHEAGFVPRLTPPNSTTTSIAP